MFAFDTSAQHEQMLIEKLFMHDLAADVEQITACDNVVRERLRASHLQQLNVKTLTIYHLQLLDLKTRASKRG